jgi:uncharacterized protein (DUF1697 family)
MTTFVALLRSVNLGPTRRLKMADLRAAASGVLAADVASIAHTGNLVFGSAARPAELETRLEAAVQAAFDFPVQVFVRSAAEFRALAKANPFPDEARADPAHLVAMVMRSAPAADAVEALRAAIAGRERIEVRGSTVYAWYPDGIGTSKLTSGLIERRLGASGTARNWNTVLKIVEALP